MSGDYRAGGSGDHRAGGSGDHRAGGSGDHRAAGGDWRVERRRVLDEGERLRDEARALERRGRWRAAADLRDRFTGLAQRYRELLPEVVVARCPDSDRVVRWPIDTAGLDGWFWHHTAPISRSPTGLPPSWLAMTGAMRLAEPVEHTAHLAVPGPGAPFVLPRLLAAPGGRAVVAEVPVGAHTGWAVTYFGPQPAGVPLTNRWGTNTYQVYDDGGDWQGWAEHLEQPADRDFELGGWLSAGRLLWIAPGDTSATLRRGADGCPYLDLPGRRELAYVLGGAVRYA